MPFLFDPRQAYFRSPAGAVPAGEPVRFTLGLPAGWRDGVLQLFRDGEWLSPQQLPLSLSRAAGSFTFWAGSFLPAQPALMFYGFSAVGPDGARQILRQGADRFPRPGEGPCWQLTVYDPAFSVPDWAAGGLYYQIFPDRFCASGAPKDGVPGDRKLVNDPARLPDYLPDETGELTNRDYFGGDLPGITAKLPFLASLGVSCLYLNPICEAHSNHRYNTADYRRVDPLLGTEADFAALTRAAHAAGIRVILDGVFSHTGSDSVYFNAAGRYPGAGAAGSTESPYYPWYRFHRWPDQYDCWWGFPTLPNLNETDPGCLAFFCGPGGVLDFWMDLGADGFRLDVADELPDAFLEALRARVKARGGLILGEVWEDASNKVAYGVRRRYLLGSQLDTVTNYPVGQAILRYIREGDPGLGETVLSLLENYPPPALAALMTPLSTHDIARALTALAGPPDTGDRAWQAAHHTLPPADYHRGAALLKLAAVLQYFLPGCPCLYYGDEAGMTGYRDPFNRCFYPWGREDPALLSLFAQLGALRARFRPVLSTGDFQLLCCDSGLFCFTRTAGGGAFAGHGDLLAVAVCRGDTPRRLPLPAGLIPVWGALDAQGCLVPGEAVVLAPA